MPTQILPRETYFAPDWFQREQETLFAKSWQLVGFASDFENTGDFVTARIGVQPIAVVQDANGRLNAFKNICRHRGTELLEGKGNAGKTLVCPYHRWTFGLDGSLRGVPDQAECFPGLDRTALNLHGASVGQWKGMVFANPDPDVSFADWIAPLDAAPFPHDITDPDLQTSEEFVYLLQCNWKVFFENAIDGYHLAYLHEKTLGGPKPGLNVWDQHGQHMVWYSTERDGIKNRIPTFVEQQTRGAGMTQIKGAGDPGYGGVYMMFPSTMIVPSPWSLTVSTLEPQDGDTTILRSRTWSPKSWWSYKEPLKGTPGYDAKTGLIESRNWTQHPLETGDFQTEDVWVCEKMQRSLRSPDYAVAALAEGLGGEVMLAEFQKMVRDACA